MLQSKPVWSFCLLYVFRGVVTYMVMHVLLQAEYRKLSFVVYGTQAFVFFVAGRALGEEQSLRAVSLTVLCVNIARNCWGWAKQLNLAGKDGSNFPFLK